MGARRNVAFYGTRFDAQIEEDVRAGASVAQIAIRLKLSPWFIGERARTLGLSKQVYANACAAKARNSGGGHNAKRWRAFIAEVGKTPSDQLVSDVARSLRARPAELSEAAIAALHERGLTVDELCEGTRRPPSLIVRAVREAARCA